MRYTVGEPVRENAFVDDDTVVAGGAVGPSRSAGASAASGSGRRCSAVRRGSPAQPRTIVPGRQRSAAAALPAPSNTPRKPITCSVVEVAFRSAYIAPTTTMPCTKFEPDMSGVWRITGTRPMLSDNFPLNGRDSIAVRANNEMINPLNSSPPNAVR